MGRDPGVGQEVAKPISGMGRQPLQDILEVGKGIDPVTLGLRAILPPSGHLVLLAVA